MALSTKTAVNNDDPAFKAIAVTPSDTVNITTDNTPTRGLYVGTTGDVTVVMADGNTVTFVAVAAGVTHPWCVLRVNDTGTDADDMVALF